MAQEKEKTLSEIISGYLSQDPGSYFNLVKRLKEHEALHTQIDPNTDRFDNLDNATQQEILKGVRRVHRKKLPSGRSITLSEPMGRVIVAAVGRYVVPGELPHIILQRNQPTQYRTRR